MPKQKNKVDELKDFYNKLCEYFTIVLHILKNEIKTNEKERFSELVQVIGRQSGYLGKLITELTGLEEIDVGGKEYDMWVIALKIPADRLAYSALGHCITVTNKAIGQLENDIKTGKRDKQGNLIEKPQKFDLKPPKAFISHGKESAALRKLKEFIEILGITPLIVKKQASFDKDVPDKVNLYLNQADFVVILATGDDEFENKLHPRQNVIHEIGLAQKTHPGRIIYLLEEGAEFPSNISPRVWENFKQRNMMDAFLGIVRELRAYGILQVIKAPIKEHHLDQQTI